MLLLPPEFLAQQAQQGPPFGWPMAFMAGPGAPPPGMGRPPAGFPGRGGGGGRFPGAVPVTREVRDTWSCLEHVDSMGCAPTGFTWAGSENKRLAGCMQRCTADEETGEVTVRLGRTDIVKVGAVEPCRSGLPAFFSCQGPAVDQRTAAVGVPSRRGDPGLWGQQGGEDASLLMALLVLRR